MTHLGRTFGKHYLVERLLGVGGMGEVYLARDTRDGSSAAIKVLTPDTTEDAQRKKRFLREAWAVSQLSHPCIVRVFERGDEPDGIAWMAMEYIEGITFGAILDRGALPLRQAASVLVPVARALGAAHRAGFVHRDVKPDNVLVRGDGRPVLVDFGIMRTIQHRVAAPGTVDQLTRTGMLVGTPEYMSPEQIRGNELDGRSDQFSLAVMCYEALTGERPFVGDSPMSIIAAVLTDPVVAVCDRVPGVPREVSDGIARALSKKPQERYPDIDAFADLLEEFMPTDLRGINLGGLAAQGVDTPAHGAATVMDDVLEVVRRDPTTEPEQPKPALPVTPPTPTPVEEPDARATVRDGRRLFTLDNDAQTVVSRVFDEDATLAEPSQSSEAEPEPDLLGDGVRTLVRAPIVLDDPPAPEPSAKREAIPLPMSRLQTAPRPAYGTLQQPPPRLRNRRYLGLAVGMVVVAVVIAALLVAR